MYLLSIAIWNALHLTKCDKLQDETNETFVTNSPKTNPRYIQYKKYSKQNEIYSIPFKKYTIQMFCYTTHWKKANIAMIDMKYTPSALLICLQSAFQNNIAFIYWEEEHKIIENLRTLYICFLIMSFHIKY